MKKMVLLVVFLSLTTVSCIKEKEVRHLTKQEIRHKIDSIVAERTKELEEAGKVDLNLRYKIEVKVKADSIINARKNNVVKDSASSLNKVPGIIQKSIRIKTVTDTSMN